MSQIQILSQLQSYDSESDLRDLMRLWSVAENVSNYNSDDFDEDCKLQPFRDRVEDQQNSIANVVLKTQTQDLNEILGKLLMWQAAYGPSLDQTLEQGGDTYRLLVVSAIRDLKAVVGSEPLVTSIRG